MSYWISLLFRKSVHLGRPATLSVEPTTACNLNCVQCPSGMKTMTREQGKISLALYDKILKDNHKTLSYLILYFQGEPFLHDEIFKLIRTAHERKVYTATSTNGHFLTEENCRKTIEAGLDKIIISLDGIDQETYESYRIGGDLQKVVQGIKMLTETRKKMKSVNPEVEVQFLITRFNEKQALDMRKLARELDVDKFKIKTAQVYDFRSGNDIIPTIEKYARYRREPDGSYTIKNKLRNRCWRMWSSAVITWNGMVVPCCFDKNGQHKLGDLNEVSLNEVWFSDTYNSFRNRILISRKNIEMCKNCTEGLLK